MMDMRDFLNVPFDEMDASAKSRYISDEIMDIFRLSETIGPKVALAIICLTIFVNLSLMLAILVTGNIKKSSSSLELVRGVAEISLMISISAQVTKNMYNTIETEKAVSGFVLFLFFSLGSVNVGFLKSFTGFLRETFTSSLTGLHWLIILAVFVPMTISLFIILCVVYVSSILGFVILMCIFYYIPFIAMWIIDGLRFLRLKRKANENILEMEELKGTSASKTSEHAQTTSPTMKSMKQMSVIEMSVCLLYGFCHTVAFAVVTLVIVRIIWVFFRPFSMEVRLESIPGLI